MVIPIFKNKGVLNSMSHIGCKLIRLNTREKYKKRKKTYIKKVINKKNKH